MNPFIVSGFAGPEYFCNRKAELSDLKEAFRNQRNVTLYSLRRMGKSSLVKNLFGTLKKEADCIYVDIFSAMSLHDMVQLFANAVTVHFGHTLKSILGNIPNLIKSINASVSYDPITGKPEIKIALGNFEKQKNDLVKIIKFLEKNKKRVLIAFDEFQSILRFPEKNVESLLRTVFQDRKNINFIYCGSSKGMMTALFNDSSRPFYQSTQHLYLEEIKKDDYSAFIIDKFRKGNQKIDKPQVDFILDNCRCHTYYVQFFCNRLFSKNFKGSDDVLHNTLEEILHENQSVYFNYRNLLTDTQWKLVRAVAKEGNVEKPLSSDFIGKHNLKSSSSVQRSLASLLEKEILINYRGMYMVYDVYFSLWLKRSSVN
ncbi:MAG: ATP-binding protein [Ignavibacteria bacterium]|nr:ATP-binding protein [Ignavibacteria bacterium]